MKATFTKDGKITVVMKVKVDDELKEQKHTGTYKVDGHKVTVTRKEKDKEEK